jgi:hypothetical protein
MGEFAAQQVYKCLTGSALDFEITEKMLLTIA